MKKELSKCLHLIFTKWTKGSPQEGSELYIICSDPIHSALCCPVIHSANISGRSMAQWVKNLPAM